MITSNPSQTLENELNSQTDSLASYIGQTYIVAYKEKTTKLEEVLAKEGLSCEVIRQINKPEFANYSRSYLCLMNHRRAWEKVAQQSQASLIMEADFVPVVNMGKLPLPFNPQESKLGIAWLYTCAPQIYSVSAEGYAQGYSTSLVAYVITPQSAKIFIELSDEIREKYGATNYSTWDSQVDEYLRKHQFKNFLAFRNYGEHGGIPNPEHKQNNLSTTHRADVLAGKLAFMPDYATTKNGFSVIKYWQTRAKARFKGIARLLLGKFVRFKVVTQSSKPQRMLNFAVGRQFTFIL